jgi:hypothetical protein
MMEKPTKLQVIMVYTLFILAIAALILAILNIFILKQYLQPEKELIMPIACLKYSESVNEMLDSMGVKGVRVIAPEEFDNNMKNYKLYIDVNTLNTTRYNNTNS